MKRADKGTILNSEAYATAADFEQIFTEDMSSLYLLAFLLTENPNKAEECFVASLAESTKSNPVFKEWARSWARRTIIQSAIRLIAPRQQPASAPRNHAATPQPGKVPLVLQTEVLAILELAPFERFVFVMSALERYTHHDCSILLGCSRRDIAVAWASAVRQLGGLLRFQHNIQSDVGPGNSAEHENARWVMELAVVRHFATQASNRICSQ